jgi:hypothetical protein
MSESKEKSLNTKELLVSLGKEGRKIRYNDRVQLEVLEDTKHYKKGAFIAPHRVIAEELVKSKIAKEVKG